MNFENFILHAFLEQTLKRPYQPPPVISFSVPHCSLNKHIILLHLPVKLQVHSWNGILLMK